MRCATTNQAAWERSEHFLAYQRDLMAGNLRANGIITTRGKC